MRRSGRTRAVVAMLGLVAVVGAMLIGAGGALGADGQATFGITVDNTTPSGHNFEYTDFFPRTATRVHQGEVVDFRWALTPDGFHTATVLRHGLTPDDAFRNVYPFAVPDDDDGAGQLQFSAVANLGTQPPPGAPGGCGDQATPCSYDGSRDVSSAAMSTDGQSHFFVKVDAPVGAHVDFICIIHPGMRGSLRVVKPTQALRSAALLDRLAHSQYRLDTASGLRAVRRADRALVSHRADGHRLIRMEAGTAAANVEVNEMLPTTIHIHPGDVVQWRDRRGINPHTVTFPEGTDQGEPIVPICEGPGASDTAFTPPTNGPPCGDPAKFGISTHNRSASPRYSRPRRSARRGSSRPRATGRCRRASRSRSRSRACSRTSATSTST